MRSRRFLPLIVGSLIGMGIILGTVSYLGLRAERTERRQADDLTKREVERIVRRIVRLERPATREILERIVRGLDACRGDPRCGRALRAAVVPQLEPLRDLGVFPPPATVVPAPRDRPGARRPPRPRRDPDRPPARRPPPPVSVNPPVPPDPPSRPPVEIDPPDLGPIELPQVCTGLVDLNCDG